MDGMKDLLAALGFDQNGLQKMKLVFIFWASTATFSLILAIAQIMDFLEYWEVVIVHIISWGIWFLWQAMLFPYRIQKNKKLDRIVSYRKSFYWDILPGIAFGVSLMLRPFSFGLFAEMQVSSSPILIILSLVMMIGALIILFYGFRELGVSGASFLTEFSKIHPSLITVGIYSHIRHPIFLGGIIGSLGISLLFFNFYTLVLVLVNIGILPIYAKSEDLRLFKIFGKKFVDYSSQTGAFIPKFNLLFRKK